MANRKKKNEEPQWAKGLTDAELSTPHWMDERSQTDTKRLMGWDSLVVIDKMEEYVEAVNEIAWALNRIADALETNKK